MNAIGVIPARYKATRFEGKVLANLKGKPIIQHVYEMADESRMLDDLIVAADDERIIKAVKEFGGKAVLTSLGHQTGTDRLTEIINPLDVNIVVNIQADEPFVHHSMIDDLVNTLTDDASVPMATVIKKIDDKDDLINPNIVKVVIDKNGFALYFSRSPIPFERGEKDNIFYKHLGLYAYTKDFLFTYTNLPQSRLEKAESLEQLRALEHGFKIKTIETDINTIGIDTPEDLKRAEKAFSERA
ncbi:MAG: 3-deoxy-manno-octulosonate cytidylyltransferase [Candidatus Omnitrophota bacterium]